MQNAGSYAGNKQDTVLFMHFLFLTVVHYLWRRALVFVHDI